MNCYILCDLSKIWDTFLWVKIDKMPIGKTKEHLWNLNLESACIEKYYYPQEGSHDVFDIIKECYGLERNFCNRKIEMDKLFPQEYQESAKSLTQSSHIKMSFISDDGQCNSFDDFPLWFKTK
jgi:hypothetical protein